MNARVRLVFPETLVREPVLSRMIRRFSVEANIRRASIEDSFGWIVCELEGATADVEEAMAWLGEQGVGVEPVSPAVEG